jgi:hypothetical protein
MMAPPLQHNNQYGMGGYWQPNQMDNPYSMGNNWQHAQMNNPYGMGGNWSPGPMYSQYGYGPSTYGLYGMGGHGPQVSPNYPHPPYQSPNQPPYQQSDRPHASNLKPPVPQSPASQSNTPEPYIPQQHVSYQNSGNRDHQSQPPARNASMIHIQVPVEIFRTLLQGAANGSAVPSGNAGYQSQSPQNAAKRPRPESEDSDADDRPSELQTKRARISGHEPQDQNTATGRGDGILPPSANLVQKAR